MIKAGYHRTDITPEKPYPMAGFDLRKAAFSGIHDPIFCTMLVLEQDGKTLLLGSFDLLGVTDEMVSRIKDKVCELLPIKQDAIFLAATHTHAAPQSIFPSFACYDAGYVDHLICLAVDAAKQAYDSRYPVTAAYVSAKAEGVASYRDRTRDQSAYAMPCDGIYFQEVNGARSMLLASYACHPTVMNEQNLLVTRDLVYGFEQKLREDHPSLDLMLLNGACGDLSTRYTRTSSDFAEVSRLGGNWAKAVSTSLLHVMPLAEQMDLAQTTLFLPPAVFFTPEQRAQILPYLEQKIEHCTDAAQAREYIACRSVLQRVHYGESEGSQALLGIVSLGDVLFCTLPFEYASADADVLKQMLGEKTGKRVILCCYCGGYEGYLPSGRPLDKDSGYEDMASHVRHDAKKRVAEAFLQMVEEKKG